MNVLFRNNRKMADLEKPEIVAGEEEPKSKIVITEGDLNTQKVAEIIFPEGPVTDHFC